MKILLVEPAKAPLTIGGEDVHLFEPLALEYLAAGVGGDHDVRILDLRLEDRFPEVLISFEPDLVGITAYTVHVNSVRRLFDEVKTWNPVTLTVVGGHHATVAPQDLCQPSIDLVVQGDGVFALQEIARRHEKGEGYEDIPGVSVYSEGRLLSGPPPAPEELDALPFPARQYTAAYRPHYFGEWMKPLASIRTSKGCPFRCRFCALWKLTGGKYLKRQPKKVLEELGQLDEEFVFFADDESLVDVPRMKELATLIKQAGLRKRLFLYGRSDTIAKNPDLLEMWRDVGLERVFVGLEFCTDEYLGDIRKGSTVEDNARAVEVLESLGIDIYASLIVRPDYTRDDFRALRKYCYDLRLTYAAFAALTPLPGTDFYEEVKDQLITDNYDLFDFIHTVLPTRLPLKEFYAEYQQLLMNALPLRERLAFLKKYPLREVPGLLVMAMRTYAQIRNAYRDYDGQGKA